MDREKEGPKGKLEAVVKKGKIIYTHAFGMKNIEKQQPLGENDIFRIASISKSFSATAIMQLAEAKKLSLDDDVSNLVGFAVRHPKFPNTVITLRMIPIPTRTSSTRSWDGRRPPASSRNASKSASSVRRKKRSRLRRLRCPSNRQTASARYQTSRLPPASLPFVFRRCWWLPQGQPNGWHLQSI